MTRFATWAARWRSAASTGSGPRSGSRRSAGSGTGYPPPAGAGGRGGRDPKRHGPARAGRGLAGVDRAALRGGGPTGPRKGDWGGPRGRDPVRACGRVRLAPARDGGTPGAADQPAPAQARTPDPRVPAVPAAPQPDRKAAGAERPGAQAPRPRPDHAPGPNLRAGGDRGPSDPQHDPVRGRDRGGAGPQRCGQVRS